MPIDVGFPAQDANRLAEIEAFNKHLFRPNSYLHKWWARRSGTTFRYILKQLVDDPSTRDFYTPGGLEGKVILDPMMGGGTTLHEAIRLGANVIGVDIDPIPALQVEAGLNLYPLGEKRAIFDHLTLSLKKRLGFLYKTTCPVCAETAELQFLLYGLRRRCGCREVVCADSLVLRHETERDIRICPQCRSVHSGPDHQCPTTHGTPLVTKSEKSCHACGKPYEDVLDDPFAERYVPLAVAGTCDRHHGFFKTVDQRDLACLVEAQILAAGLEFPDASGFDVPPGPKSNDLLRRNVTSFLALFKPRQLLYLNSSLQLMKDLPRDHRLWMALLVSTSLEFNSLLCGYKGSEVRRPGAIRHVFSHHAYSFPYTALENNPIFSGNTSGTLNRLFQDRVIRAGLWALNPSETRVCDTGQKKVVMRGELDGGQRVTQYGALGEGTRRFIVLQADAASIGAPDDSVDYVVTDPPYLDSVQYGDLSTFFRVWLKRFLPGEADWDYSVSSAAVSEGGPEAGRMYGDALARIWTECHRVLRKDRGRLVFTFHHWNPTAWAELTLSLKRAGFVLLNRYVVFSENPISVHIRNLRALRHDVILVLAPFESIGETPTWAESSAVDMTDSYAFCSDCGAVLGRLLSADIGEEGIREEWKHLLTEEQR